MTQTNKKNSSKTELFWERFEKSGSIHAYLKFHEARRSQASAASAAEKAVKAKKKIKA